MGTPRNAQTLHPNTPNFRNPHVSGASKRSGYVSGGSTHGGFPNLRVPVVGNSIIRTVAYWGSCRGTLIWGKMSYFPYGVCSSVIARLLFGGSCLHQGATARAGRHIPFRSSSVVVWPSGYLPGVVYPQTQTLIRGPPQSCL